MKRGGFLVSVAGMPKKDEALEQYGVETGMVFVHADGGQLDTLRGLVDDGKLKVPHVEVIQLDEAPNGLKKLEAGNVFGKVVVKIN
jgi:NADPH-dependent curcumin reductase CurA